MPVALSTIPELGSFVDDYARAGFTTAEELAQLSEDEIILLGIAGLKSVRAAKHLAAVKAVLTPPTTTPEEPPVSITAPATAPVPAAPAAYNLRSHPAMSFLDERGQSRVVAFAAGCDRVTDQKAWLDHVYKRAVLAGDPADYLARFARNLALRTL